MMNEVRKLKHIAVLLLLLLSLTVAMAEDDWSFMNGMEADSQQTMEAEPLSTAEPVRTAREDFIDRIVSLGEELYIQADGKSQRAHYKGDIYVCKNFTVYLFRENRDDFCIAEYPDVQRRIPNNLPSGDCKPYYYGIAWEKVDAETDETHWMDSNMRGGKKNGIRYGLVQFDEVKSVEWWASTFCLKGRGATLYRLRDDIAYRED